MKYKILKGHFKGKKKSYFPGDMLEELETYKSRLPYFLEKGFLEAIEAPKVEEPKASKKKSKKKDAADEIL